MISDSAIKQAKETIEESLECSGSNIARIRTCDVADILADPDTMELYDEWNKIFFADNMEIVYLINEFFRSIRSQFYCVGFCDLKTPSETKLILKPSKYLLYPKS